MPTHTVWPGQFDGFGLDVECALAPYEHIDLKGIAAWFDLIVIGTVTEVFPAEWTTADGQRPKNPSDVNIELTPIVRPVRLMLDIPVPANNTGEELSSGQLVLAAWGGTVGQDSFNTSCGHQDFEVGERVLLALSDRPFSGGGSQALHETSIGPAWNVGIKWTLTEDGMALFDQWDAIPHPLHEVLEMILAVD